MGAVASGGGTGTNVDANAYRMGGAVPDSGDTAVAAYFRCRRVPRDRAGCGLKSGLCWTCSIVALGLPTAVQRSGPVPCSTTKTHDAVPWWYGKMLSGDKQRILERGQSRSTRGEADWKIGAEAARDAEMLRCWLTRNC